MDWHQHLGFLLDDVAHLYTRGFEDRAQELALTLTQCKALAITESAKPVVQSIWQIVRNTNAEALQGFTSDELHLLMHSLERVHANLLALEARDPKPIPAWRQCQRRGSLRTAR
jgi:hypothetical protein